MYDNDKNKNSQFLDCSAGTHKRSINQFYFANYAHISTALERRYSAKC